jgi:hypothetical protein
MWCAPYTAYEVEFEPVGLEHETRALVMAEQLQVEGDDREGDEAFAGASRT